MQPLGRLLLRRVLSSVPPTPPPPAPPSLWRSRPFSNPSNPSPPTTADDDWNAAWESAWLPEDLSGKNRAPWEADVTYTTATATTTTTTTTTTSSSSSSSPHSAVVLPLDADADTKAFVEEMEERWDERKGRSGSSGSSARVRQQQEHSVEQVVNKREDEYRLKKQRIHAGLWMKEIESMEEAKLGGSKDGAGDIERLLDSCSEIFDSGNIDLEGDKVPSTAEFKSKPDGWESTSRTQDGNIWEITQREEDILLQEFERRIAYSKFQIASFIKSHIFSRRRPIDGWKYMIEELGPNAKRGKGSVQRLPTLADPSTQPFREEKIAIGDNLTSSRGR